MARISVTHGLNLLLLGGRMSICRLAPGSPVPAWATRAQGFVSITRTSDELSIACPEAAVPQGEKCEAGWRLFKVQGPLDFSLTGVLVSLAGPLADAGVSIFAISTYETDYVMVKQENVDRAIDALTRAGHTVAHR